MRKTLNEKTLAMLLAWGLMAGCGAGGGGTGEVGETQTVRVTGSGIEMVTELEAGTLTFEIVNEADKTCYFGLSGRGLMEGLDVETKLGRNVEPGATETWSQDIPAGEWQVDCADEGFEGHRYLDVDSLTVTVY